MIPPVSGVLGTLNTQFVWEGDFGTPDFVVLPQDHMILSCSSQFTDEDSERP